MNLATVSLAQAHVQVASYEVARVSNEALLPDAVALHEEELAERCGNIQVQRVLLHQTDGCKLSNVICFAWYLGQFATTSAMSLPLLNKTARP